MTIFTGSPRGACELSGSLRPGIPPPLEVRKEIIAFVRDRESEVSKVRLRAYTIYLPSVAEKLGAEFLNLTRATPQHFREAFKGYQVWSLEGSWGCALKFWAWRCQRRGEDYPTRLKISIPKKFARKKGPDNVFTIDDITKIADQSTNLRDMEFVWTLYESGARPGEIARMSIGDVKRPGPGLLGTANPP